MFIKIKNKKKKNNETETCTMKSIIIVWLHMTLVHIIL